MDIKSQHETRRRNLNLDLESITKKESRKDSVRISETVSLMNSSKNVKASKNYKIGGDNWV